MSGFFITILVFLEILGFSGAQKNIEGLSDKIGITDPFDVGIVKENKISQTFNSGLDKNFKKPSLFKETNIPISSVRSLPKSISRVTLKISADAAYVYDLESNLVLFSKNPEKIRPIASITKIMTALVVLEEKDLNEIITVDHSVTWVTGSKMYLVPYEKIKVMNLVYGLLIKSANDAAKALEVHYGKDQLVMLMNEKAEWLGLNDTKFQESSGLSEENISSAKDLAILSNYALKNKEFKNAIKKIEYSVYSYDGKIEHRMGTTNRLLKHYSDIFGLKTGFTHEAGHCLISLAERDNKKIIAIILGSPDDGQRFIESRKLLDWAFSAHEW